MDKLYVLLFLAVLSNAAFGYRYRRQADRPTNEEDLEDRYGWNRLNTSPWQGSNINPWQIPNPNPWQRPNNMFPENDMMPFPYPNNPFLNPNPNTRPTNTVPTQPTPTQAPNNGGASTDSPDLQACIRSCPVTSEYNPVCGSNGNTYDNPGRLSCAQMCGVPVTLIRSSRCPATTTTAAPAS